jgi:hypothetical protein
VNGGWIVAWLDEREGRPAVYAAKVGRNLERIGEERKIAETRGEASELRLVPARGEVVLVWSEAREDGLTSGIFAARLEIDDASARAEPARVLRTSRMAGSLHARWFEDGLVLGWVQSLEPVKPGKEGSRRGVALARVLAPFRGLSDPQLFALPADASSLALDCDEPRAEASSVCRVFVSGDEQDQLSMYGLVYRPAAPLPLPLHFAALSGVSTEDTSPVLVDGRVFFAEDDLRGGGRIRTATITW